MAEVAKYLTALFIRYGILKEADRALYNYCFELVLIFISNFFAIILIAVFTANVVPTIFYLLGFWPLRMLAGGYHAKTPGRCFAMTLFFFLLFLASFLLPTSIQKNLIPIFVIFSIVIIFLIAPVDCPNKRFREKQRRSLRLKSRLVIIVFSMIVLCSSHIYFLLSYALSFGTVVTAFSLLLSTVQSRREGGGN